MSHTIIIDGAAGEGGGQMIRTGLSLSAITGKPVRFINIRANRPNPGLQMQHLTAAKAIRSICRGRLEGAALHSKELEFYPGRIVGGKYHFDIGTAGSVVLVAQTVLPVLSLAAKPTIVKINGGTHVMKSPSYDYFEHVFLPAFSLFGGKAKCKLLKPGFYPKGGGEMVMEVEPAEFTGNQTWLHESHPTVIITLSGLPMGIAIREKKIFIQHGIEKIMVVDKSALDVGNAITAWKGFIGACALGEKGKRAEIVAQEVLDALNVEGNSDVDRHLADQLLLYAAMAKGKTMFKTSYLSNHFWTNLSVIAKFLSRKVTTEDNVVTIE